MANPSVQMSEETKKFQEAVNSYFDYNKYGYTPEKGYWLLFLLYLVKNNALQVIDTSKISRSHKSKLKVFLCYSFKNIFKDVSNLSDEYKRLATCDCVVINLPDKDTDIQEIADGLGLRLDYNYHKDNLNIFLVYTWTKLLQISPLWYEENSLWAFKEICKKISERREFELNAQPEGITNLIISLLDVKKGDIYYPYANWDVVDLLNANRKNEDIISFIQPIENHKYALIRLALLSCDLSIPHAITNSNPLTNWRGDIGFDYIVSTPPWSVKSYESNFPTIELDYLAHSSRDTKYKSIGVYTSSICYSGSSKSVIKELIDNDWLETVILLPKNIFSHTAIETTIIVVNKNKEHIGKVQIIDASDCYIKDAHKNILDTNAVLAKLDDNDNFFSNLEIGELDYDIYPQLYVSKNNADIPENYLALKVNTILESYNGSRHFSDKQGKMVTIVDLSDNSLSSKINIEELKATDDLSRAIKVTEPVFLFSRIRDLKPSYCEATPEHPIFLHPNVFAYKLRSENYWVDYQYFCYEISRRAKDIAVGVIPSISKSILQRLNVYFPSENIEDQKHIVKEALLQLKLSQARELGLLELIESMKEEYMNEVRNRKHEMGAYIATLTDIHEDLVNLKVQERYIENQKELNYQCNRFEKALNGLKSLVSIFSDEIEAADVIDLNIDDYFKSLVKEHNSTYEGYNLIYKPDIDINALDFYENSNECENIPLYVEIAKEHFNSLISNIIQNAKRHGFVNRDNNNYKLEIKLSLNTEDLMFQIDFINNGTPLPKGMDKTRYGILGEKAGTTGNTGIGGNRIKNIVKLYNGDYDVFMDNDNTVIRILLPISSKKYEQDV